MAMVSGLGNGAPNGGGTSELSDILQLEILLTDMVEVMAEMGAGQTAPSATPTDTCGSDPTAGLPPLAGYPAATPVPAGPLVLPTMGTLGGLRSLFAPGPLAPPPEPLIQGLSAPPVDVFPSATLAGIQSAEELF